VNGIGRRMVEDGFYFSTGGTLCSREEYCAEQHIKGDIKMIGLF
jgi:hypothetical protein